MKPSKRCYDLIREFEGLFLHAYVDPGTKAEPITIGWGTTSYGADGFKKYGRSKVRMGDTLTRAEADSELVEDVEGTAKDIMRELGQAAVGRMNQNQWDAAVSFFFNLSRSQWGTQLGRLKAGELEEFSDVLPEYRNKGTSVEAGLLRRRKAEQALFNEPIKGAPVMADKYYLINKDGLWLMEDKKALSKIRSHSLEQIITANLMPYNIVVEWDRKVDEPEEAKPDYSVAKLTRYSTPQKMNSAWTNAGLVPLKLEIGTEEFLVVSGQGYAQKFLKYNDPNSQPGNMCPIPEGDYGIDNIEWSAGKDNYNATFGEGLGPIWIGLPAKQPMSRSAFGIHIDQNMSRAPGSAGCVVLESVAQAQAVVAALRKFDPKTLKVLW